MCVRMCVCVCMYMCVCPTVVGRARAGISSATPGSGEPCEGTCQLPARVLVLMRLGVGRVGHPAQVPGFPPSESASPHCSRLLPWELRLGPRQTAHSVGSPNTHMPASGHTALTHIPGLVKDRHTGAAGSWFSSPAQERLVPWFSSPAQERLVPWFSVGSPERLVPWFSVGSQERLVPWFSVGSQERLVPWFSVGSQDHLVPWFSGPLFSGAAGSWFSGLLVLRSGSLSSGGPCPRPRPMRSTEAPAADLGTTTLAPPPWPARRVYWCN